MKTKFRLLLLLIIVLILILATTVYAGSDYDESEDGDLSNDRLNPTVISLSQGSNTVTATSVAGDLEYFTIQIPSGFQLDKLILTSYDSTDDKSFIAVQSGSTFTEPPLGTDVSNLLGYSHFGTGLNQIGTNILDDLAGGSGAIGFVSPFPGGNYTFWSQEVGSSPATYTFDFQVSDAVYDENIDGDLSDDQSVPTAINLSEGANLISATSVAGDLEYFTTSIPNGMQLDAVYLTAYESTDNKAFLAVQSGNKFTEPPTGTNVANLLGYSHFGPSLNHVGTDILDDLGTGDGAIGFTAPLPNGDYTFWSQQTGAAETTYTFNFLVTKTKTDYLFLPVIINQ